tara:strand:+ start:911 stop:1126 length:216 start_codon:yes stop_codon:yes gene_type:complete
MENISLQTQEKPAQENPTQEPVSITSIPVNDENTALNMLVQFVHIAQKRGAFNIQESAKIWECVSKFTKKD